MAHRDRWSESAAAQGREPVTALLRALVAAPVPPSRAPPVAILEASALAISKVTGSTCAIGFPGAIGSPGASSDWVAVSAKDDPELAGDLLGSFASPEFPGTRGLLSKVLSSSKGAARTSTTWARVLSSACIEPGAAQRFAARGPICVAARPVVVDGAPDGFLLVAGPPGAVVDPDTLRDLAELVALRFRAYLGAALAAEDRSQAEAAEAALGALESRISGIARSGPVMFFAFDRDGTLTMMDGGMVANYSDAPDTLVGRSFFDVYRNYPEIGDLGHRLQAGEALRRVHVVFENRDLEAWAAPLPGPDGTPQGAAGFVVDISARVHAERAVLEASRRQSALVEHASDLIIVLSIEAEVQYANPAAARLLGMSWAVGDVLDIPGLIHPDDRSRVLKHIQAAAEHPGAASPVEYRMRHASGGWRVVEAIGNNLLDDPAVRGFVVTIHDVTQRRVQEERLRAYGDRQAALAELGRWALIGLPFATLVEDAVGVIASQLPVDFVHVYEADSTGELLTLSAERGHGDAPEPLLSAEPTSSPASFALVTQETVVSADLASEARFEIPPLWTGARARSIVEVPIPGPDSPAGVIGIGSRNLHRFPPDDVNFVVAIATVLAAAAQRTSSERAVRNQALQDPLTGLPNRLVLGDLRGEGTSPAPDGALDASRTVLVLDIDRFKEINDTLGHALGDLVLVEVANRLRSLGGPVELVARLGGDEFAVVAGDSLSQLAADSMASALLATVAEPIEVGGVRLRLRGSVGIATPDLNAEGDPLDVSALLRRAEIAMYQAKAERRGRRHYSDDLERSSLGRLALASDLADAVEREELRLVYQPKVDCTTLGVTGVEALVRWRHPTRGLLLPDMFIPLAEQTGLIRDLTRWVLERALAECAAWNAMGHDIPVAVNLSASTVHDPDLLDAVTDAVARSGVPPGSVELEITESAVMLDPEGAIRSLEDLTRKGVRFSLDDFGTGYSSLAYLQRLPVTSVKIDKSFVQPLHGDEVAQAIVRAVVELGHSLHLSVIAEGVDSAEVMQAVTSLGCDAVQGFHVAMPMEASVLRTWIGQHSGMEPGAHLAAGEAEGP